jgi:hypothetical protein
MKSLQKLMFPSLLYPGYAPDIAPTSKNPQEDVQPSFLIMISVMLHDLLGLERLILLFRSPELLEILSMSLCQPKQLEMAWQKWG